MVVHGDRQDLLGELLADDIIVEMLFDFHRLQGNRLLHRSDRDHRFFVLHDLVAQLYALITDKYIRSRNQLADVILMFAAE
ncbi:MAG: hypothetical protein ACD_75C00684G0002 [uncultured bacterium]|nr:MAG: hypothetical protein ACD_75C00684G0002 [uncultured bacterium]